jgi:hypothetical protein
MKTGTTFLKKLTLKRLKFWAEAVTAIATISEFVKHFVLGAIEWRGWASVWTLVLGLNWFVGAMIGATVLFAIVAQLTLVLLPVGIVTAVFGKVGEWSLSHITVRGEKFDTSKISIFGTPLDIVLRYVYFIIGVIVSLLIWESLSERTKNVIGGIIVFAIAPMAGLFVAFKTHPSDLEPVASIVRGIGWLTMFFIVSIAIQKILSLRKASADADKPTLE